MADIWISETPLPHSHYRVLMQITAWEIKLSREYPHVVPFASLPHTHIHNTHKHSWTPCTAQLVISWESFWSEGGTDASLVQSSWKVNLILTNKRKRSRYPYLLNSAVIAQVRVKMICHYENSYQLVWSGHLSPFNSSLTIQKRSKTILCIALFPFLPTWGGLVRTDTGFKVFH